MGKSFRVATFNTLNLLHPAALIAGRSDDPYSEATYDDKLAWITRTLHDGRVDLVGLQELFSDRAFQEIARRCGFSHSYAPDIEGDRNITSGADGRERAAGPYVGLLSKYPIIERSSIRDFPIETRGIQLRPIDTGEELVRVPVTEFQRPVIRATVQLTKTVAATVFVAHLKSKRPQFVKGEYERQRDPVVLAMGHTRSLIVRAAEAVALRKLIIDARATSRRPVIVFGDLNDDVAAVTTQAIAGDQPYRLATAADQLLYSVHDLEEQQSYRDVSYTHIFNGRYELLDHVLVSEELAGGKPSAIADIRSTRIFNDHLQDQRRVATPGRGPSARSDHGIPVTELQWRS